jgi:hypothetical protein
MKNMRLMKTSILTGLILGIASILAILLIFANMTNSLGSAAFAQGNQSQPQPQQGGQQNQTGGGQAGQQQQNQTGGGQAGQQQQNQTGGGQAGQQQQQQNQTGIGTAQELENLTGLSNETIANNTNIGSPNATTMGGLEKEQTSTETTNMTSAGGQAGQQQQNQTGGGQAGQQQQNQTQQQQNQTGGNQTGGAQNQTQKGPLEQLGETLGGIFGGGK